MARVAPLITFVIGTAEVGGAEGQLVRLAAEMKQRGWRTEVIFLFRGGPRVEQLSAAGVDSRVLADTRSVMSGIRLIPIVSLRLAVHLIRARPSVVSAWLPDTYWMALLPAMILTRAKRIAAVRGNITCRPIVKPLVRLALRYAHAITVNAPHLALEAEAWGGKPDVMRLTYNGIDMPPSTANVDIDPPTAIMVANFIAYKRHEVLVDAAAKVSAPVNFRLVGAGDRRTEIQEQIEDRDLRDRVTIAPEGSRVADELSLVQFGVHTSNQEGMANAIMEELAFGLPVIASDIGTNSLLIEDGVNGFLVPEGDAQAFADKIDVLALERDLRKRMSVAARASVARFSWDESATQFEDLLFELGVRRAAEPAERHSA